MGAMDRHGLPGGAERATVLVAMSRAEPEQRQLVGFLADLGYEVVTAADGEAALNALDSAHVDAVIADARMHRLDGLNLLDRVMRRDPEICVVLISETADLNLATEAIR